MTMAIEDAFKLCQGELACLPDKWKHWNKLSDYRSQWSFIKKNSFRETVAETHLSFDYICSLYDWLSPALTIETGHKFIALILACSIYEAIFNDYVLLFIADRPGKDNLQHEILKCLSFSNQLRISNDNGWINNEWFKYIKGLSEIRNRIHPSKKRDAGKLAAISIKDLRDKIGLFRTYIEARGKL
jgi:hypothetical protein